MSHIVKVAVTMKDKDAALTAIETVDEAKLIGTREGQEHKLYGGQHAYGIGIQLDQWSHPVVLHVNKETGELTGEASYDNYGGSWGKQEHLDRLVQEYTAEKTRLEAQLHGYMATEETLDDGSIKLVLTSFAE